MATGKKHPLFPIINIFYALLSFSNLKNMPQM